MTLSSASFSAEEMVWLEANRMMVLGDYHAEFVAAFGRGDVSKGRLHSLRKRKGWKVGGRQTGRYVGRRRKYSDAEISWLHQNYLLPINELHAAFCAHFERRDVSKNGLSALRNEQGLRVGSRHRVGWNKGKKMPFNPKRALPRPNRRGVGVGREWTDKNGYVWIVTGHEDTSTGMLTVSRRHKHRVLWEQKYGPIPVGYVLKCLGDRGNTAPSNWDLVPEGIIARLSKLTGRDYDQAPTALKPTIMAIAKLEHRLAERRKREHGPTSVTEASE